jgi:transposase
MLTVETIGRIRREHFIKGKTIKEIARDLKVSRNTVRRVLRSGATSFEYERDVQPRPKLGRWTEELEVLLAGNAAKPAREQLAEIEADWPLPWKLNRTGHLTDRAPKRQSSACGLSASGVGANIG